MTLIKTFFQVTTAVTLKCAAMEVSTSFAGKEVSEELSKQSQHPLPSQLETASSFPSIKVTQEEEEENEAKPDLTTPPHPPSSSTPPHPPSSTTPHPPSSSTPPHPPSSSTPPHPPSSSTPPHPPSSSTPPHPPSSSTPPHPPSSTTPALAPVVRDVSVAGLPAPAKDVDEDGVTPTIPSSDDFEKDASKPPSGPTQVNVPLPATPSESPLVDGLPIPAINCTNNFGEDLFCINEELENPIQ